MTLQVRLEWCYCSWKQHVIASVSEASKAIADRLSGVSVFLGGYGGESYRPITKWKRTVSHLG